MKFIPQRMKFLHSIDGVNYSLDFFFFFFFFIESNQETFITDTMLETPHLDFMFLDL